MRKFRLAAFFLLSTVATAAGGAQSSSPTKGWPTATPQSVGLNVAVLDSIHSEIAAGRYGYVDRMLVIRRGRVVYDKSYAHDYDRIYGDSARVRSPLDPEHLAKGLGTMPRCAARNESHTFSGDKVASVISSRSSVF